MPSITREPVRHGLTVLKAYVFPLGPEESKRAGHDAENAGGRTWLFTEVRIATPCLGQQDDRLRQDMAEVGWIDLAELRGQ